MAQLPRGYKTVDRAQLKGALKNLSPLEEGLRSLLVKDSDIRSEREAEEKQKPPVAKAKSLSDIVSNNIQASNDLRTITHYIKRAEQIWTTLLTKPNGDQPNLLIYDSVASEFKNTNLHNMLLQVVKNYFTTKYPFEQFIPQIIKDVLIRTGSYTFITLSHAVLDHLINGYQIDGNESQKLEFESATRAVLGTQFVNNNWNKAKNVGYIRSGKQEAPNEFMGFESLYGSAGDGGEEFNLVDDTLNWTFTDNPVVLKTGELIDKMRNERLRKISGLESVNSAIRNVFTERKGKRKKPNNNHIGIVEKRTLDEELKRFYPDRKYDYNESVSIRKDKFYSGRGRGLGITYARWPSEAIINVSLNGNIGEWIGHVLLTDPATGGPLKNTSDVRFYQKTKGAGEVSDKPKSGSINDVIAQIRRVGAGEECQHDMGWMVEMASAQLEKEMMEAFLNGDLKKDVTISLTEENKKLYLSRAMRDQGVRAVFIPAEYVSYIAVDYSDLGVGRSLVDEAKIHISRLAIFDTADALAQIENAISHTLMTIDIEKEDFEARNLAAMVRDEYFANNPTLHDILGYNNVSIDAILDRFKEQSLTIKMNAPDNGWVVSPTIEASQMDREPLKNIDRDARENLLNIVAGFFGLKRSWLEDTGEGNDFAIEALADQELLRNQTNEYSKIISAGCTAAMRKHMQYNTALINDLIDVIRENKTLYMKPDQTGSLELDREGEEITLKLGDPKSKAEDTPDEEEEENEQPEQKGKSKKKSKKEKEPVEPIEPESEDGEPTDDEYDFIELVLNDFLNGFFVTLPTPAITDSLNKLDDKLESVDKLVTRWVEMGGGAKLLKRYADEVGYDSEAMMEAVKAVLLNEAFDRFNLPMPFESILNDGKGGGLVSIFSHVSNMNNNILRFLKEWQKVNGKNLTNLENMKKKLEELNNPPPEEIPAVQSTEEGITEYDEDGNPIENTPEEFQSEEGNTTGTENVEGEGNKASTENTEGNEGDGNTTNEVGGEAKGTGDDLWDIP